MATDNTAQLRADADRNKAISRPHPGRALGESSDLGGTAVFSPAVHRITSTAR